MTNPTPRGATKHRRARATSDGKPTSAKARLPVKGGSRPAVDVQQRLFAAAFGTREMEAFGSAAAGIVAEALDATAAVLAIAGEDGAAPSYFACSEAIRDLVGGDAGAAPLLRWLATGKPVARPLAQPARGRGRRVEQDPATPWRHVVCLPLVGADGSCAGGLAAYFAGDIDTAAVIAHFDRHIGACLTAAVAARRGSAGAHVDTHQFDSLAATIPGVVYQRIVYPDGNIRYSYLSEGAREMFGVDPSAVIKDPNVLFSTFTKDYAETFRSRLMEASKALAKWDVEASMILPDGRRRTTHAIARPERRPDGSVLWTGVILDASRAKEAEDNLKAANRQVGLANEAKSAFLAKMSHEMRTPLNGVLGMGDLLLKTELSPRQLRLANTLCDSAKGLLGIINDVLDLSRIEAGHFKLDFQDFNLRHCVEDAVELCATAGYRKGLEINLIVAPDVPVGVKSDPVRLRQVLINLIGNAIKFTEQGEVVVRLSASETNADKAIVAFEVTDTGIGIDEAAIGRLFEPFAQADSSISRRFGGTGLGLSITRHLVELLGGTVALTSRRGAGTTVRFAIPFEVTASAQTATIMTQVSLAQTRVLVLDDRASNRDMLVANLAGSGARVHCAASEKEAEAYLAQAHADGDPCRIVIVDRPRVKGSALHFCRTIRADQRYKSTAFVILMSPDWNANPIDQHGLGQAALVTKPLRRTDLVTAVARLLEPDTDATRLLMRVQSPTPQRLVAPSLKLRVLLAEDNATNIEVAREYLTEMDCRVTVAVNGIEALSAYDRANFDIVLMDTQMPELDGLSATRRIRECERLKDARRIPIIAVTANAYESDRQLALEAGSDDFLSKPYTETQLRDLLLKWTATSNQTAPAPVAFDTTPSLFVPVPAAPHGTAATKADGPLDDALHSVLLGTRPAFLGRLIRAFLSSLPETVAALKGAVAQSEPELLRGVAHSLKSASANVGAKRLSELCRMLDMKLRLGAEAADCETLAATVEVELHTAETALEGVLAQVVALEPARSQTA